MTVTDYYALLGVDRKADDAVLKRAYRRLARELHPDVNPSPEAQERFKQVSTAYEVLSDPEKRRIVDLGGDPMANGGGGGGAGGGFAGTAGGIGDLFDAFFGGAGGATSRGPRSRVRAGNDALIPLDLDMAEAAFGVTTEITVDTAVRCETCGATGCAPGSHPERCPQCEGRGEVQTVTRSFLGQMVTSRPCPRCAGVGEVIPRPCTTCGGDGRVRSRRSIKVKVPPGVEDGMRIRLSGEGEVGPGGGPAGDLYVEVRERRHPMFQRDERGDLWCELTLPMTAAALGTSLPLETLDGSTVQVDVKPGTQGGQVLTLPGHGVPRLRTESRGDLHVTVTVQTPTRLDAEQETLLRQLAVVRDEQRPDGSAQREGIFGRLRDAFR
jgi:molecular chaperone DnaJ